MAASPIKPIRAALVSIIQSITTANGYNTNLAPTNVHRGWSQRIFEDTTASLFPRVFIVLDDAELSTELGGVQNDEYRFLVFAQFRRTQREDVAPYEVEEAKDDFIEDFRTAIDRNSTLGQVVQDVQLPQVASDSGTMDPLGMVVFEVVVKELGM